MNDVVARWGERAPALTEPGTCEVEACPPPTPEIGVNRTRSNSNVPQEPESVAFIQKNTVPDDKNYDETLKGVLTTK